MASALYLLNAAQHDELLQAVVKHQLYLGEQARYSNLQRAIRVLGRYQLWPDLEESARRGDPIPSVKEGTSELKAAQACQFVHTLMSKPIHKVYIQTSMSEDIDKQGTFAWLSDGRFRAETEALVIAAQDGVIMTNRYKHTVLKQSTSSTCRVCREEEETIGHILSACGTHCWSLYKERHDRVVYQKNDASFGQEARCDGADLDEVGSGWLAWCGSTIRRKGQDRS